MEDTTKLISEKINELKNANRLNEIDTLLDIIINQLEDEGNYNYQEIGMLFLKKGNELLDDDFTDILLSEYLIKKENEINEINHHLEFDENLMSDLELALNK